VFLGIFFLGLVVTWDSVISLGVGSDSDWILEIGFYANRSATESFASSISCSETN